MEIKYLKEKRLSLFSKQILIVLSIITFLVASKGLSILYLFLLADCSVVAVLSIFYGFYNKNLAKKKAYSSILLACQLVYYFFQYRLFKINFSRCYYFNGFFRNYLY